MVAAALAFVVLNMGFFTSQRSKDVIGTGLGEASSAIEIDGTVVAGVNATAQNIDYFYVPLRLSAGKSSVDVTPGKAAVALWSPTRGFTYSDIYVAALSFRIASNDKAPPSSLETDKATPIKIADKIVLYIAAYNDSTTSTFYLSAFNAAGNNIGNLTITYSDYLQIAEGASKTFATFGSPSILEFIAQNLASQTGKSVAIIAWTTNRNPDFVVDPGEKVLLFIYLWGNDKLNAYDLVKAELRIPVGAPLTIERSVPASLTQEIVDLG